MECGSLEELVARVQPDAACVARWISVLESRLDTTTVHGATCIAAPPENATPASQQVETASSRAETAEAESPERARRPPPLLDPTIFGRRADAANADVASLHAAGTHGGGRASTGSVGSTANAEDVDRWESAVTWSGNGGHATPPNSEGNSSRLPSLVTWAITLSIPVLVAVTNNFIVWADGFLLQWKFRTVQNILDRIGIGLGALAFVAINCTFCLATACLVTLLAPICAGSGLPEAKGYLNGNEIRGLFKARVLFGRVVGIILAIASGLPIGREGPMVAIGGGIGYAVTHLLALPSVRQRVRVDTPTARASSAVYVDEERFSEAKRIGFALGGAAGIATAFDAPIGGILYMFEEATMTSWPPALTFRAFVCTVCACLLSMFFFNLAGHDVHRLLIYLNPRQYQGSWDWQDVPLFVALAASMGLLSAVFTRVLVVVWSTRRALHGGRFLAWQPGAKIVEAVLYAMLCSLAFILTPSFSGCVDAGAAGELPSVAEDAASVLVAAAGVDIPVENATAATVDHTLEFVQHVCSGGKINQVATLLLQGTEGSLKHLFSRNTEALNPGSLVMTFSLYIALNAGLAGIAVPMGNFIPSMLIGALSGRFLGEMVAAHGGANGGEGAYFADAGVYAMVGSAAMLGGFTHMTLAVVVILVEAARDLSLVSPLMLSIFISHIVSACVIRQGYDEVLILRKGVPFLNAELPSELDHHGIVAADLCESVPDETLLPREARLDALQRALDHTEVVHFPVIEDGVCIGLASRARLEAALRR
eukprot:TRINITY_DN24435_c0_g1_i2.p1 TRINITY_DN24435_c0_g1~~TRINITY_DN24435_c0_g1_i2.p1  ORF type:complete len:806 (-),score=150.46 TRINITY_DN24435_c0_g1_i2:571-2874(-)